MTDNKEKYLQRPAFKGINTKIVDKFVEAGLEQLRACINCGTCSGSCPSGRRTAYRTRSVLRRALIGDVSVLSEIDIWFCSTCYTCAERCPRNIPVTDMIIKLRNIAVENAYILDAHAGLSEMFYACGHGVPAHREDDAKWRDLRESYGLPALPPTVHSFKKAVDEIQTLMKSTGFRQLMDEIKEVKAKRKAEAEKKTEM